MLLIAKHKRYHGCWQKVQKLWSHWLWITQLFIQCNSLQSTKDIIVADKKFREYGRIGLKFLNFLSNVINCKTQKISFCWHHYCWQKVEKIWSHWLYMEQKWKLGQCNTERFIQRSPKNSKISRLWIYAKDSLQSKTPS